MNHYQFILMLGQDSFYDCVKVTMPYQAIVTYKVINDAVEVVDLTIPYKDSEFMDIKAIRRQAKEAAENNAIEMGYIGQAVMVTIHELLKINP